jgi:hypothetical protein
LHPTGAKQVSFPNKDTQFRKGKSGNPNGRPKGSISLSHRIKPMLEDGVNLPKSVKETIKTVCGEDKAAIDALILVGLLQGQLGDKAWAEWLTNNGYGKPVETLKHQGDADNPVALDGRLEVVLVRPRESSDG